MITGHVLIATSLDGFVARKDGSLDWLMKQKTDGEEHGFTPLMALVDGLVMGRNTYQTVLSFGGGWPYTKPVVVASRSLTSDDVPEHLNHKVRLTSQEPQALMQTLAQEGWQNAYVDGGVLVQSFIRQGLISEITLTRVPILIGEGIPLFGTIDKDIDLVHISTETFPSGLITSKYRIE